MLEQDQDSKLKVRIADAFLQSSEGLKVYKLNNKEYHNISTNLDKDENCPKKTFTRIVMPFENNSSLQKLFKSFSGNSIRTGRLLELLDYLAVEVSNKFCNLDIFKGSKNIVTVCVDHV